MIFTVSFYRQRKSGSESWTALLKGAQLGSVWAGIWIEACVITILRAFPQNRCFLKLVCVADLLEVT